MTHDEAIVSCDVAIVGGGPAGMMAAIAAGEAGRRVAVCEQLPRPGVKLLATGGGRCNLTNTLAAAAIMAAFGRQGRFMQPALDKMDGDGLREFFDRLGVATVVEEGGMVFPACGSAAAVQEALLHRCEELSVRMLTGTRAAELWIDDGHLQGLRTESTAGDAPPLQQTIAAARVIVAAGGSSYPKLGGTGGGYALARQGGHQIVPPTPALVGLVTREGWPGELAGLSVAGARVWIDLPGSAKAGATGNLLFTHGGLSGPAAMNLSGDVAVLLRSRGQVPIRLELTPQVGRQEWTRRLDLWRQSDGRKMVQSLLAHHMPQRLAERLCRQAGAAGVLAAHLGAPQRDSIVELLAGWPLEVRRTEGFDSATVTRGGVKLKEVEPHTLASRLLDGLYFAGEVLDLDGPCGGFNLQWAFSSGYLAGASAAAE